MADVFRRWMSGSPRSRDEEREVMLARLRTGGVHDPLVLRAMELVPREEFVARGDEADAYADRALAIGHRQTISQPLMVAVIVQALELGPGDRALDVGTGSGYQAAVMAACGARVISIERIPALATSARSRLARLGFAVEVVLGDGSVGLPERAPFDAIAVGAAAPTVPAALMAQLAPGGRLAVPVSREVDSDRLILVRRDGDVLTEEDLGACRFVPLLGDAGYPDPG